MIEIIKKFIKLFLNEIKNKKIDEFSGVSAIAGFIGNNQQNIKNNLKIKKNKKLSKFKK